MKFKTAKGSNMSYFLTTALVTPTSPLASDVALPQLVMAPIALKAFCDQIIALRPMLKRFAHQRLRNDAWADDAVSETVVAALTKPSAFARRAMLQSWLVGILKNKIVDQIRRHTRECQVDVFDNECQEDAMTEPANDGGGAGQASHNDPQECLHQRQFLAQVDTYIKTLPPREARAFMLYHWIGEEIVDICNELDVSTCNLHVILYRARSHLRAALREQWAPGVRARVVASSSFG